MSLALAESQGAAKLSQTDTELPEAMLQCELL